MFMRDTLSRQARPDAAALLLDTFRRCLDHDTALPVAVSNPSRCADEHREEVSVADNMFQDVVEASIQVGGKRKYSLLVSIVTHTVVIAATIIVPIVATDSDLIPVRTVLLAFAAPRPMPPPLPPPRSAVQAAPSDPAPRAVPLEAPSGITAESEAAPVAERLGADMTGIVPGGDFSAALIPSSPASAPPAERAPVRPGGDIKPPVKIKDVAPEYPRLAEATGLQGIVVIYATIGPTWKVHNVRVLRSIPLLDGAAIDAVRQWEYTPTLLNGSPVAVVMTVTVHFRLR
jgi:protein TonB